MSDFAHANRTVLVFDLIWAYAVILSVWDQAIVLFISLSCCCISQAYSRQKLWYLHLLKFAADSGAHIRHHARESAVAHSFKVAWLLLLSGHWLIMGCWKVHRQFGRV